MKISKRELNKIIKESMLSEGFFDDLSSGFDTFFQDDEADASGKRYDELEKGEKQQAVITKAGEAGGVIGRLLQTVGVTMQVMKKILAFFGIEEVSESILERSGAPLHAACLWNFISLKQSTFELDSSKNRRAMFYVCKAAEKRGKKAIHYVDFLGGQKLDPEISAGEEEGIVYSSQASYSQINPGTYGALSLAFGECNFKKSGDGYYVYDRYDFNLDKNKKSWTATGGYAVTLENIGKVLSVNFSDAMLWIGSKIPGIRSKSSTSLYRIVEDVCLMYQTTLNYKGYLLTCKTIANPDKKEKSSTATAQGDSSKNKLNTDVFPGSKWNDDSWISFIDAEVAESMLPEGLSIDTLKTDWKAASKILKYKADIGGINSFILDAYDGKFAESLTARLTDWATGDS